MNKVTSVNLNGRAYQVEEAGYNELKHYLDQAARQLAHDPDKDEIIADFEQAIAEKCDEVLTGAKTVVTEAEVKAIIEAMGPVNGESDSGEPTAAESQTKRFYLIKEGAMIGGVCTGLAAYFNVDVTVIRLAFILLTIFTSGFMILAYVLVMLIAPVANTPEEKAAARGQRFNSKELLAAAKQKYSDLDTKDRLKRAADGSRPALGRLGEIIRQLLRLAAGVIAALGVLVLMGIIVSGISSIWSLLFSDQLFGFVTFDPGISTSLLAILIACGLIVAAVPVFLIMIICFRYAKSGTIKQNIWAVVSALALFTVALGVGLAIFSTMPQLRNATVYHKSATVRDVTHVCVGNCAPDPYPTPAEDNFRDSIPPKPFPQPWYN